MPPSLSEKMPDAGGDMKLFASTPAPGSYPADTADILIKKRFIG